jgi:spoIIIJ-associated protein
MNERHHSSGSGPRRHGSKRPNSRDHHHPRGEARLDHERALAELKRFLDLAVREMGLAVQYDITSSSGTAGSAGEGSAGGVGVTGAGDAPDDELPDGFGNSVAPRAGASADPEILIAFRGDDADLLLERNAELLLALEHVAHRWLRLDPRLHDQVRFDCGDYRAVRLDELKLSARVAAQRVRETGQPFRFNPMSPRERRIIHLELTGAQGVRTASEGVGDRRQLVIYPATKGKP